MHSNKTIRKALDMQRCILMVLCLAQIWLYRQEIDLGLYNEQNQTQLSQQNRT